MDGGTGLKTSTGMDGPRQGAPASRQHRRAVATALFVTALWSSSWILVRFILDDRQLGPITFAGLRYALAGFVLLVWTVTFPAHRRQLRRLDGKQLAQLAFLGLVMYSLTQGAQFIAIAHQPAATSSLVLSLTALLVAFSATYSLGEQVRAQQFAGAALVVAGAALYFAGNLGATVVGMAASVVGLLANVGSSLLGRALNRSQVLSPAVITVVSMMVGGVLLLFSGLVVEGVPHLTPRAICVIAWLAVVNTAVAFTLWNSSLRHLPALESAAINNTMLIQIAGLAWLFLGEAPGAAGVAGVLVVSLGVFLTQQIPRNGKPPAAPDTKV